MSNWQEVLDLQLRLHRALGQGRIPTFIAPEIREHLGDGIEEAMSTAALGAIQYAAPVHVDPEIAKLWDRARADFAAERFNESEPFVAQGFAVLPDAYTVDAGYETTTRAFLWAAFPGGVAAWGLAHLGQRRSAETGEEYGYAGWALTWGNALYVDQEPDAAVPALRDLQAFWRLGREFIVEPERAPRAQRRQAQRAKVVNGEYVTVLRLRRHVRVAAEVAATRDWSCRWIVRGHWRNQWYPSLGEHRQRYVAPHIKGPPDKPLQVSDRAVEFVR